MATIKVNFTKDILTLVSNIRFKEKPVVRDNKETAEWFIDMNNIYGGSYLFEDISYLIGRYDEHIPGTENDFMGVRFESEFEDYMYGMHSYIIENLEYIEEIVHQFCARGGIREGTYKCKSNQRIWEFAGE